MTVWTCCKGNSYIFEEIITGGFSPKYHIPLPVILFLLFFFSLVLFYEVNVFSNQFQCLTLGWWVSLPQTMLKGGPGLALSPVSTVRGKALSLVPTLERKRSNLCWLIQKPLATCDYVNFDLSNYKFSISVTHTNFMCSIGTRDQWLPIWTAQKYNISDIAACFVDQC